jgi:hypothetical protein
MTLNLAHYEKVYNNKFKTALSFAQTCIETMGQRPPDMDKEYTTVITMKNINGYKGYYEEVCIFLASMMFSSGYWHTNTIRKQRNGTLNITFQISIMTDAQKKENLEETATLNLSDDGYSSDDDEPSPKSEIATPA